MSSPADYEQIRADEEYARRLYHDENPDAPDPAENPNAVLFRRGSGGAGNADNNRAVHANVQANIDTVREQSPRLLCIYLVWAFLEITTTIVLLVVAWGRPCDRPLKYFILFFTSRFMLLVPLRIFIFKRRRAGQHESADAARRLTTWMDFAAFVWFIVGQTWLYGAETCATTNAPVYYYAMVLVILIYVSMALPILVLLGLCICLPCVLLVLRLVAEPRGASESVINKLPRRTFDQDSQRERERDGDADDERPASDPCSICRSDYAFGDELMMLPCGHEFHVDCVSPWLKINQTCPLCRADIRHPDRDRERADRHAAAEHPNAPSGSGGNGASNGAAANASLLRPSALAVPTSAPASASASASALPARSPPRSSPSAPRNSAPHAKDAFDQV